MKLINQIEMDAEKDASGKLLQEKSNDVYGPTTERKVSLDIRFFKDLINDHHHNGCIAF